jgi:hypothetical protein
MQVESTSSSTERPRNGATAKTTPPAIPATVDGASVPKLERIHGDLRGRMLAWQGATGVFKSAIHALGSWNSFPWRGKSFTPRGSDAGDGINRVISDRWKLFTFTTFVGPSRAGDFQAVQLDYDHPSNPFFIRAIKDEIRELSPGLFLGQAYLQLGQSERLVLYFGLQQR